MEIDGGNGNDDIDEDMIDYEVSWIESKVGAMLGVVYHRYSGSNQS